MIANAEVVDIIMTVYQREVTLLTVLRGKQNTLYGVYYLRDISGSEWIIRIVEPIHRATLENTALLFRWLEEVDYPAPRLVATATGQHIGFDKRYAVQMLTYIPGAPISRSPADLGLIATVLASLHVLGSTTAPVVQSWWYSPNVFLTTAARLTHGRSLVSSQYQPLIDQLLVTVHHLQTLPSNGIVHGDCWYPNAIRVREQEAVLIDWDCAGLGPTVLDLGALLLTSHYDLSQPLHVDVTPERIEAILACYGAVRPLSLEEVPSLIASIPFYLAFNAGRYLATKIHPDEVDVFQIQKLAARHAAVAAIGAYTLRYAEAHLYSYESDRMTDCG